MNILSSYIFLYTTKIVEERSIDDRLTPKSRQSALGPYANATTWKL